MTRGVGGTDSGDGSGDELEPSSDADGGEQTDTPGGSVDSVGSATLDSAQVYWVGKPYGYFMEAFSTVSMPCFLPCRFIMGSCC